MIFFRKPAATFRKSWADRAVHSLDDSRLRRLVEIGMHRQTDDVAGQAFAGRQTAVGDREIPVRRLLMHRFRIIDRGWNALRRERGGETVAIAALGQPDR